MCPPQRMRGVRPSLQFFLLLWQVALSDWPGGTDARPAFSEERSCAAEQAALPSTGRQLTQLKMDTTSAARSSFHVLGPTTMLPLSWRSIREFPAMPVRQPSRCREIGRHFPELVSRDQQVLDTYETYACLKAADTFMVDPEKALTAELAELKAGCINAQPWPELRFASNQTHAEMLYRPCDAACQAEAWDSLAVREVDEELLVIPTLRTPPKHIYQHALLDFVPQAWTALDFVRNSNRKLLTHHPVQSKLLQKLGVDLANILEMPFADAPDPGYVICVAPARSMHLWRVSDSGDSLPTFSYRDRRLDADLWHRMINWQVGHELSDAAANQTGLEEISMLPARVVFLQRCTGSRAIINEQAALAVVSRVLLAMNRTEELLSICSGRMNAVDQLREVRSARLVIGEHGGAMANSLFIQPSAGVIEFVGSAESHVGLPGYWPPYKSFWYGGSGAALKFFRAVLYQPDADGGWSIRLDDLEDAVSRWIAQEPPSQLLAS